MVKKVLKKKAPEISKPNKITKKKGCFTKNLSSFLSKIEEEHDEQQTSITIIPKIHKLIHKYKKKMWFDYRKISQKIKICRSCDKWIHLKNLVQCKICEDSFHIQCPKQEKMKMGKNSVCNQCLMNSVQKEKCYRCKDTLKRKKIKCCKCQKKYDEKCFNPKKQKCKICAKIQNTQRKKMQVKHCLRQKPLNNSKTHKSKKQQRFCMNQSQLSHQQIEKYKKSLLAAIQSKKMIYTQDLDLSKSDLKKIQETSLDFGIQQMKKQQKQAFQQYKNQPIGPYILKYTQQKGFDVIADKDIPAKSIICEYIGQVFSLRQCVHLPVNDSSMQLQKGINSLTTLIIRPQKFTNLGRFINGVNDVKNANVETIRIIYKKRTVVLLLAKRMIKKGESLGYDYNAGNIKSKYDTSGFI